MWRESAGEGSREDKVGAASRTRPLDLGVWSAMVQWQKCRSTSGAKEAGGGRNAIIFPGLGASEANDALFRGMSGGGTRNF